MSRQMDWQDFFEQAERQRLARAKLIDELDVDPRVKALLRALDRLTDDDPTAKNLHNGTVRLSVPIDVIAFHIKVTGKTVKSYIDLAGSTPYLAVVSSTHRSHTYLIRWLAIVDNEPGNETHAGGCQPVAAAHGRDHGKGLTRSTIRGGKSGGRQGGSWEETRGVISSQLPPEVSSPLKTGLKDPVFNGSDLKDPVFKTGVAGGKFPPAHSPAWWRAWKTMIAARNLADPCDIDILYGFTVATGLLEDNEVNRFRVFAQASVDRRRANVPGAIFRENVAWKRWYATCDDEDVARQMFAQLQRELTDTDSDHVDAVDDLPIDRSGEIEKLKAWEAKRASTPPATAGAAR